MAEHRTPDHIFESSPRSFGVGSKIGDHLTNAAGRLSGLDARQSLRVSQVPDGKKLALGLPALPNVTLTFRRHLELVFLTSGQTATTGRARVLLVPPLAPKMHFSA
jgi:hypothetical protein